MFDGLITHDFTEYHRLEVVGKGGMQDDKKTFSLFCFSQLHYEILFPLELADIWSCALGLRVLWCQRKEDSEEKKKSQCRHRASRQPAVLQDPFETSAGWGRCKRWEWGKGSDMMAMLCPILDIQLESTDQEMRRNSGIPWLTLGPHSNFHAEDGSKPRAVVLLWSIQSKQLFVNRATYSKSTKNSKVH